MKAAAKAVIRKQIGRREFLLAALGSGSLAASYLNGQDAPPPAKPASSAVRTASADNIGAPLITSNADFFIRNHFETQKIDADAWSLVIAGAVSKPLTLSYSDLLLTSSVRRTFTLECAGNRAGMGGVSTAAWSGLPLADLLQQAGVLPSATTVVLAGADSGEVPNAPNTHFARAIPLEKATDPSTLLAYEMNGAPLSEQHGFPLRAVVPGWYGMDSVKWLTRIDVLDKPFTGFFQDQEYVSIKENGERRPVTRILVNSKILRPSEGEEIRHKTYRVEGAAWTGEGKIAKVELRAGSGEVWQPAILPATRDVMVWTPWSYEWQIAGSGQYTLEVRATDDDGHVQPDVRDPQRKDAYELNTPHRIHVTVRL